MLKHLMMVLAFASAGAFAEDVYTTTQPNGCKVHNPNPYSNDTAEWQGACNAAGFAEGEGVLRFRNHLGVGETELSGSWQNGKLQGIGKIQTQIALGVSRNTYRGEFRDSLKHGIGIMEFPGGFYTGEFRHDQPHGLGTMIGLLQKDVLHGQWENGSLRQGEWFSSSEDNRVRYSGVFHDAKPQGFGTMTLHKDSKMLQRLNAKQRTQGKWQGDDYVLRGWFENGNFIAPCATAAQCAKRR
ncbi:hypothetical protein [Conchiformibius kuhniae]|uniref:MORN repeat-containing protein n=1 Tax=Conchiformibius kuhniae TaxID=211502 RepID=A0A8T9MU49_9NEIS|nr:hypothetical protein [Conchiformibius kuhniae]UOP04036.1 hypothetical protein LVJ77_05965 [Conchiformibius kuhniae]